MSEQPISNSRRQMMFGGAVAALAAAMPVLAENKPAGGAPEGKGSKWSIDALKELHDSYFKAFSAHDVDGVLALFAPNAIILGTGPGEIWGGSEEIGEAHRHFFEAFDAGKQEAEVLFRSGNIMGGMAWVTSVSKVRFTKETGVTEFGLNKLVVFERTGGKWLIRAMHFSNLTAEPAAAKS